jgi:hypothetical protein
MKTIFTLAERLNSLERGLLNNALRATAGSVSAAARCAGIDRNQFYRRAEAVGGVNIEGYRAEARGIREAARAERQAARDARRAATRARLLEARRQGAGNSNAVPSANEGDGAPKTEFLPVVTATGSTRKLVDVSPQFKS